MPMRWIDLSQKAFDSPTRGFPKADLRRTGRPRYDAHAKTRCVAPWRGFRCSRILSHHGRHVAEMGPARELGAVTCLLRGNVGEFAVVPGGTALALSVLRECADISTACGHPPSSDRRSGSPSPRAGGLLRRRSHWPGFWPSLRPNLLPRVSLFVAGEPRRPPGSIK